MMAGYGVAGALGLVFETRSKNPIFVIIFVPIFVFIIVGKSTRIVTRITTRI